MEEIKELPIEDQKTLLYIKEIINKYYRDLDILQRKDADNFFKLYRRYCSGIKNGK